MVQRKRTNNDLQNTTQKTKDRATRTPLKNRGDVHLPKLKFILWCFNMHCWIYAICPATLLKIVVDFS